MQLNNIVMALAGAERIFALLDEQPEVDDGYVTLVRAKWENGQIVESKERTGMWAWKHTHQADGSVDYIELKGDVVFDDVDFGYVPEKTVLHNVDLYADAGSEDRLCRQHRRRKDDHHQPDQPFLRYPGRQDPL